MVKTQSQERILQFLGVQDRAADRTLSKFLCYFFQTVGGLRQITLKYANSAFAATMAVSKNNKYDKA